MSRVVPYFQLSEAHSLYTRLGLGMAVIFELKRLGEFQFIDELNLHNVEVFHELRNDYPLFTSCADFVLQLNVENDDFTDNELLLLEYPNREAIVKYHSDLQNSRRFREGLWAGLTDHYIENYHGTVEDIFLSDSRDYPDFIRTIQRGDDV